MPAVLCYRMLLRLPDHATVCLYADMHSNMHQWSSGFATYREKLVHNTNASQKAS